SRSAGHCVGEETSAQNPVSAPSWKRNPQRQRRRIHAEVRHRRSAFQPNLRRSPTIQNFVTSPATKENSSTKQRTVKCSAVCSSRRFARADRARHTEAAAAVPYARDYRSPSGGRYLTAESSKRQW